jgi:geranylgeranyl reductase family protein
MTAEIETDVLVVGLGPAGATAAAAAAGGGARVIAIDRKRQAGVPVQCAEFVPTLLGSMLDASQVAPVASSLRQHIRSMTTFIEQVDPHIKEHFPGQMLDRAEFDTALVRSAQASGAACRFSVGLSALDKDGAATLSNGLKIRARVIIGADGPRSRVGRAIGQVNGALAETRQITVPLRKACKSTDIFLSAAIPGGYAWLFPKGEEANLGLGVAPAWRQLLKPQLNDLHHRLVVDGRVGATASRHTGGAIPVGGMLHPRGNLGAVVVLLTGDAAGLTNPITGAGISAAVISGRLAGEAAAGVLSDARCTGRHYAEELEDLFKVSLERALARRQDLMRAYASGGRPCRAELQRSWIAFPQYWAA